MFKGQKVVLRAMKRDDVQRQWQVENDAEMWFLDGGRPRVSSLEAMLADFDSRLLSSSSGGISFAIEADGQYIGHCGLHSLIEEARHCELSIEIGDRAYWGRGYGRDTIHLLLKYAFEHMNLERVWLTTHSENERAIRCYKACGFVEEGRLRQHLYIGGRYVDRVMMGILRSEMKPPAGAPM
jgi:RimJ/RimL family protein N-acetyltransferase